MNFSHSSLLIAEEISFPHFLRLTTALCVCVFRQKIAVQVLTVILKCLQSAELI